VEIDVVNIFLGLFMCLIPGLLWLWFFYRKDLYEKEPLGLIFKTFFLGAMMIFPVVLVELYIQGQLDLPHEVRGLENLGAILVQSFIVAALVEEYGKYLVVKLTVYKSVEFNEVMDGIVYSVSAALGFATLENFFYFFQTGYSNIILRSITAMLGHICYSGIMGYYLGLSKFTTSKKRKKRYIRTGLLIAILLHGLYDFLIFSNSVLCFLIVPLLIVIYRHLNKKVRLSLLLSPFRPGRKVMPIMDEPPLPIAFTPDHPLLDDQSETIDEDLS
jgi:RsiW-degrading membrane proteinase PrsW (M82 family)